MGASSFTPYCPVRRNLEERCWNVTLKTVKHSALSARLEGLVGIDFREFQVNWDEWQDVASELTLLCRELEAHRKDHGC